MKNLYFLAFIVIIACITFLLSSCGGAWRELKPVSNTDSIKVRLEISADKSGGEKGGAFSLRITNFGEGDYIRCSFKFDDKYEHIFAGLINKDGSVVMTLNTSFFGTGKTFEFEFSENIDNFNRFGLKENNNYVPSKIEFNCQNGKVVWQVMQEK
ncbi:MAG: hypothetical protein NTV87_08900 [Ignavibacteriae bacterium]|nr:hypothetical protein [Ignavibacteriota bacterium]